MFLIECQLTRFVKMKNMYIYSDNNNDNKAVVKLSKKVTRKLKLN